MRLHVYEDNAMNYIALELPGVTGSVYVVFDHDISEAEIATDVSEYEAGTLIESTAGLKDATAFNASEFDALVKLNHSVW